MKKVIMIAIAVLCVSTVFAQAKGDNLIRVVGTPADNVLDSYLDKGYVQDGPMDVRDNKLRYCCVRKTTTSILGVATIKVWLRRIGEDSTQINASVDNYLIQYGNGWQKIFLQLAAIAGGKGGTITYARTEPIELTKASKP